MRAAEAHALVSNEEFEAQMADAKEMSLLEYQKIIAVRRARNCNFLEYAFVFDDGEVDVNDYAVISNTPETVDVAPVLHATLDEEYVVLPPEVVSPEVDDDFTLV